MTMTEKIFARASEEPQVSPGENVWVNVDVLMTHDISGPGSIGIFKREFGPDAKVFNCCTLPPFFFFCKYFLDSFFTFIFLIEGTCDMDTNVANHQTWLTSPEYGYKNVGSCREFTTRVLSQERGFMQDNSCITAEWTT